MAVQSITEPQLRELEAPAQAHAARWGIVLAGGDGVRLRPLTKSRFGAAKPKQYCAFWGRRSMLQWTLDRTSPLCSSEHTKLVITAGHERFLDEALEWRPPELEILTQPTNRGTLAGLLLPLLHILEADEDATVVVLPSDHFVYPESEFVQHAQHALCLAEQDADRLVLLGAVPDRVDADYGWIKPERTPLGDGQGRVKAFVEKPTASAALTLFRNRWLWNTMVFAAKAKLLWQLASEMRPDVVECFEPYRSAFRAAQEGRVPPHHRNVALLHAFQKLPSADFSRDILQRASTSCDVVPLHGVYWSDCGRPERLVNTLRQYREEFSDIQDPTTFLTLSDWASMANARQP